MDEGQIPQIAPEGCWFAHVDAELGRQLINSALQPVPGSGRGVRIPVGKSLTHFCQYPNALPAGILEAARLSGVALPDPAAPYERSVEFRSWLERLLMFHGITFGGARFFRKEDPDEKRGYRVCGVKRIFLQMPYYAYRDFAEACAARAKALPELIRPIPHSDKDRDEMLKDIVKEAKDRGLCCSNLKSRDLKSELFFAYDVPVVYLRGPAGGRANWTAFFLNKPQEAFSVIYYTNDDETDSDAYQRIAQPGVKCILYINDKVKPDIDVHSAFSTMDANGMQNAKESVYQILCRAINISAP